MILRSVVLIFVLLVSAGAGDLSPLSDGGRHQFKESKSYPYIFEPVHYLEQGPPKPLRFGENANDCSRHNPPLLPTVAKKDKPDPTPVPTPPSLPQTGSPSSEPEPTVQPAPSPVPESKADSSQPAPAYAAPPKMQEPEALDTTKYPDEVVDYFKNPYNVPKSRKHFFEPIFEPAPAPNPLPSKATYRQE